MKQLIFLIILAISVSSCKKDDEEGFELRYSINFDIPAGLSPVQAHFWELYDVPTAFFDQADLNNYSEEDVRRIHSKFINLNLRNPSGGDFKWIERIYMYVNNDSLPRAEIGYLEFVPNNAGDQLNLVPSQTDLIGYLTEEKFDLIVEIQPFTTSPLTTSNTIDLTFHAFTTE